ncbi:signal recognition particle-docking protein FtsY [Auritidibacter ignavus]|uniref:signal recognition particle-docking protein FtsY n=1 Tax=Auritidibacter TaxID=1160973 RepID=UPI001F44B91B|nr:MULTISPECIES: signal recognition particle-docking protein FtsY [Auritidibacter]WGH81876.1 signal recognition particle-docking protein FtsY [Auritidibacter ignavus]WGH86485.1 signal recognition particle-docking protein FtsY [Auritidibacter ignavus]WGH88769.1 signal recognition particle-docking protein FtsY [Auritidibacter ignavus]WGH91079.1 signal recognition particle-docking protein FtsY [Auritidibacter ignavus]
MEILIISAVVLPVLVGLVSTFVSDRPDETKVVYTTTATPEEVAPSPEDVAETAVPDETPVLPPSEEAQAETEVDELETVIEEPIAPELEKPEAAKTRLGRLRARLVKSNNIFSKGLLALLSQDDIDDDVWDEIEETLLTADLGSGPALELVDKLRERVTVEGTKDTEQVREMLREELINLVDPTMDRRLAVSRQEGLPSVVMVVGVNGVGKTTTVGKIGRVLVAEDHSVLFGAADTFRAAAAEQLATWGSRVGVETVRSEAEGTDPASVAFDAVQKGIESEVDTVIVDTAGRLQNKGNLMDELGKIKRVSEKQAPVREVLLVIDATTGQNGLTQAKVFTEAVNVTGIVLTKLDGSAKGGIVVAIQRQLGVPVKLIGLGEGADDLAPFDTHGFVDALIAE